MTTNALSSLLDRIQQVRRLRSTRYHIIFLCTLIGIFGFLFIAFSALDIAIKLDPGPRAVASSACLLALIATLWRLVGVGLHERREAARLAAEVERMNPQVETALSTSIEFGSDPERTERLSSQPIVDALVEDTEQRAAAVNFLAAVNWRRAQAAAVWLLIIVGVCGFYSIEYARLARLTFLRMVQPWKPLPAPTLTLADVSPGDCEVRKLGNLSVSAHLEGRIPEEARIQYGAVASPDETPKELHNEPMTRRKADHYTFQFSRLTDSLKFRVLAGDFRSQFYYVDVFEVPRIVRINMTLTYPEYCGLEPKELKDSIGPITALRGTRVRIQAFANKKLRRAGVRFHKGAPNFVAATLPADDEMAVEFTITQNDRYKIWLADAKGRVNEDAVFYTIKALDDERPKVVLKRPKKDLKARKTTEVNLEIEASDDYGISSVGIAYKIKTDAEQVVTIDEFKRRMREAKSMDTLFLEEMGLADTDIVTYYAFAMDNDTVSGPKVGRSALHFIEISPYAMQYKKDEKKGGAGKKKDEGDKEFIPKLDDVIKKQKKLLADTFGLNSTLKRLLTDEQSAQIMNLGSKQEKLRNNTEQLARRLMQNLMKLGLSKQIDRAEHLVRSTNEMGLASYLLSDLKSFSAVKYENTALYHLYRAKRDLIKLIQETKDPEMRKKLEQALQGAAKDQQEDEQKKEEQDIEELRQQAKQIERMRDQQKKLNEQLEKLAAKKLREQTQKKEKGDSTPKQNGQQAPEPGQVAKKQSQLSDKAEQKAQQLAQQAQQSERLPINPAEDMARAANEMKDTAKALQKDKQDEARDRGKKADQHMKKALREIKRAMERSLAQQLKDAAKQARELADKQKQLREETQQAAKAPQQPQQQQTQPKQGQPNQQQAQAKNGQQQQQQAQAKGGQQQQNQQQQQAKAQSGQRQKDQQQQQAGGQGKPQDKKQEQKPQRGGEQQEQKLAKRKGDKAAAEAMRKQLEETAKAEAQKTPEALAKRQENLRRDLEALGKKLEHLGERVKETEPEIGNDVQQIAKQAQQGKARDEMEKAKRDLEARKLAQAADPQRQAERQLDKLAKDTKEAADEFAADDEERLAKAIQKAESIAKKQEQINKNLERMKQMPANNPARPQQAKKLAKELDAARKDTQTLAKQVDRIRQLQEAGMDEQIQDTVAKAAEQMAQARDKVANQDPEGAKRKGAEAKRELDQTAKALRQQMKEALSQKLARAVDAAKKALEKQESAKAETQKAQQAQNQQQQAKRQASRQQSKQNAQQQAQAQAQAAQNAANDQAMAKAQTQALEKELDEIERQAKKTHPKMAKDVGKIAREMKLRRPVPRMERAQRDLERKNYKSAQNNQAAAAKTLAQAQAKLDDLYKDTTSMPLATLKAARQEAEELQKQIDQMKREAQKLARQMPRQPSAKPSERERKAEKQLQQLQNKQASAEAKADRFADRVERLKPDELDGKAIEELKAAMKDAAAKLGQRRLKEATVGHSRSQRALQKIGDGIIKRIERMIAERKRKEPMEEHAPDQYKELVRRYYEALSAK